MDFKKTCQYVTKYFKADSPIDSSALNCHQ